MEEPNPPENRNINTGGGNYNERIEGDYIQNNFIKNIFNILGGQTTTPLGNPERPKNERILLAAVKEEVIARLRQSLHNAVLINLGKESQPQQVKRPWDAEIKIGLKPAEPLPDNTTILSVFDSTEIAGKLLILGAPGAGKTTTQLELAQELIKRAEEQPDYPVPVLLNLSSWKDDRQSLTDWLMAELKSKYGVSIKLGKEWINNHQLLPLLDGLDELESQRQELCVYAINQFLAGETRPLYLVVCSRIEEYNNYATQLQLNGAIYLQPLTTNQICDYLTSINYIKLWSTISNDLDLLELVKIPLILSITVLASQEISVESWQHLNSTADRIQYLLDAYVGRMLTRDINSRAYLKNKPPNASKTGMWLVWLAQQMQRESKTEFLIEEMQPSLLKNGFSTRLYNLICLGVIDTPIVGLISGLIFWLIGVPIRDPIGGLQNLVFGPIVGLIFSLTVGLFGVPTIGIWGRSFEDKRSFKDKIDAIQILQFSFNDFLLMLGIWLISGLLFIPAIGFCIASLELIPLLIQGESFSQILPLILPLIKAMSFVPLIFLTVGLVGGLSVGFDGLKIENKTMPNQGIWLSAKNAVYLSVAFCLIFAIFIFLIKRILQNNNSLNEVLIVSLVVGLFLGLLVGARSGTPVIKHFTLRLILYRNGYIPWNYARFLDYCTERLFLQRVGGRYRFMHKLLQDHFAQMDFKRN
jgi:hypothetical protein